jgi:hypothetical protein
VVADPHWFQWGSGSGFLSQNGFRGPECGSGSWSQKVEILHEKLTYSRKQAKNIPKNVAFLKGRKPCFFDKYWSVSMLLDPVPY